MGESKSFPQLAIASLIFLAACAPTSNPNNKIMEVPVKGAIKEAQIPENWFTKGPEENVEGAHVDYSYEQLKLTKGQKIVVAVVDSGVDILHEDLKNKIWKNKGETGIDANGNNKETNNIDDDKNGYIDDVYGWNFIGGQDLNGKPIHISSETLEVTRELVKMKKKEQELLSKGLKLNPTEQAYLDKVTNVVNEGRKEANDTIDTLKPALATLVEGYEILKPLLNIEMDDVTVEVLESLSHLSVTQTEARDKMLKVFKETKFTSIARVKSILTSALDAITFYYNEDYNPRKEIVGDDPENFSEIHYGNNDVIGPDSSHGTHVAGIIAADRVNSLGIQGIATNVEIMPVRAVPDGDERDKDVANAIRYAVDNGAHIINMSFGKSFSPNKIEVSLAMQYAAEKGVLLVHAAGNDSKDNDTTDNFPYRVALDKEGNNTGEVTTWVEVGASTPTANENLPTVFTNYGKTMVDIFAPGYRLRSTTPSNTYSTYSGTSMAAPVVSGVLALVMSQRSDLSPWIVRQIVLQKPRLHEGLMVNLPGSDPIKLVPFNSLSIWGGVVDAFNALTVSTKRL